MTRKEKAPRHRYRGASPAYTAYERHRRFYAASLTAERKHPRSPGGGRRG